MLPIFIHVVLTRMELGHSPDVLLLGRWSGSNNKWWKNGPRGIMTSVMPSLLTSTIPSGQACGTWWARPACACVFRFRVVPGASIGTRRTGKQCRDVFLFQEVTIWDWLMACDGFWIFFEFGPLVVRRKGSEFWFTEFLFESLLC